MRLGRSRHQPPILLRAPTPASDMAFVAFQFRADDGTEITATSLGGQSEALSRLPGTIRLRFQLSSTGDIPSTAYKIQYRRNGSVWKWVNPQGV